MPYTRQQFAESVFDEVKRRRPWWLSFDLVVDRRGKRLLARAPHGECVVLRSFAAAWEFRIMRRKLRPLKT